MKAKQVIFKACGCIPAAGKLPLPEVTGGQSVTWKTPVRIVALQGQALLARFKSQKSWWLRMGYLGFAAGWLGQDQAQPQRCPLPPTQGRAEGPAGLLPGCRTDKTQPKQAQKFPGQALWLPCIRSQHSISAFPRAPWALHPAGAQHQSCLLAQRCAPPSHPSLGQNHSDPGGFGDDRSWAAPFPAELVIKLAEV